ncbi:MAG: VWA domain-containing protein [Vicinamibacteria bacterium]
MNPLALLLGIVLSVTGPSAQDPVSKPLVFDAAVENVYIDAFISQRGAPLTGLQAADFELRDNGVVQSLEMAASDTQPLLAVLAFDVSGSLDEEKLSALRAASNALLETLRPEDEASLFAFADEVRWLAEPTTDKQKVRQVLENLRPGGGTPIMDALYAALTLPKSRGRSLIVLFTDGVDNLSWLDGGQVRLLAEKSNAVIHVVSLQPAPRATVQAPRDDLKWRIYPAENTLALEFENAWMLRQIAEATGGHYWEAESLDRLKAAFAQIAETMGKRYVLRYSPEGTTRPGWHKIELKLKGKKGDVRTRTGYWVADRK